MLVNVSIKGHASTCFDVDVWRLMCDDLKVTNNDFIFQNLYCAHRSISFAKYIKFSIRLTKQNT